MAGGLAARVQFVGDDPSKRLEYLFNLTLARPPTSAERTQSLDFMERYRKALPHEAPVVQEVKAWAALCRTLLGRNEFIYVD
jgi:hypothetical protein